MSPPVGQGSIRGTITDANGTIQPLGRIYLLLDSGLNENRYADVDSTGHFSFDGVDAGGYQVRYWAGSEAAVPEPLLNPVRVTVIAGQTATVNFTIELGADDPNETQIYIGDYFFQEQPFGAPNAQVTVKLGTVVCWYNVAAQQHTVTGGPWVDSGLLNEADEFNWVAHQVGTFGYRCRLHNPTMRAILEVVP